jgi:hypothetical protein
MSPSERSWFVALTIIALVDVCGLAVKFRGFVRADADLFDFLALVGLMSATLYAWLTPRRLMRSVDSNSPELQAVLLRKVYGLSTVSLSAIQLALMFAHPLR